VSSSSKQRTSCASRATPARPRDAQLVRCFEELLGAVLLDISTYPLVRPYLERCEDVELDRIFTALGELYADETATIDESSVLTALAGESCVARVVPIVDRVRSVVVEEYTAKRVVLDQIGYLDRRDQSAQKRAIQVALSDRERQVMRDAGEQRAATDPVVLENARRLAAPNGAGGEPLVHSTAPTGSPAAPHAHTSALEFEPDAPTTQASFEDDPEPSDHFFESGLDLTDRSFTSEAELLNDRSMTSDAESPSARWFESEGVPSVPTHVQDSIRHG
jgi:hypothetical protein